MEWTWRRSRGKCFLELHDKTKRLGLVNVKMDNGPRMNVHLSQYEFCSCGPDYNCYGPIERHVRAIGPRLYFPYVGGKALETCMTMEEAKNKILAEVDKL
jgi:hypothetical protein